MKYRQWCTQNGEISISLSVVDLAGSEKVGKTGTSGQTLEEAKKINSRYLPSVWSSTR